MQYALSQLYIILFYILYVYKNYFNQVLSFFFAKKKKSPKICEKQHCRNTLTNIEYQPLNSQISGHTISNE